jgi:alkane 1-monooxygenase
MTPTLARHGFWLAALLPLLMPLSWSLRDVGLFSAWWSWLPLLVLFVILPAIDHLVGRFPDNPSIDAHRVIEPDAYPDVIVPLAATVAYLGVFGWSMNLAISHGDSWTMPVVLGWVLSLGDIGGVVAINVAHEWIHRRARWQRMMGGVLLSCVVYPGFKLEHPRWHHVNVATPEDPSSAPYGANIYAFVPRALALNTLHGWTLSVDEARRRGRAAPWILHEMTAWWLLVVLLGATWFVLGGLSGLLIFLAQGFVAASLLEVINFIEHYGLRRQRLENGRYEPPGVQHSWNADHWLSNAVLINLQRHSDHHVHPTRPFTRLQSVPEAPLLPMSYSTLSLVAYVPPLWRRIIHPHLPSQAG